MSEQFETAAHDNTIVSGGSVTASTEAAKSVTEAPVAQTSQTEAVKSEPAATDPKAEENKAKAEGAPEAYEEFTLPEGLEYNQEIADTFKPIAKELNLSQGNTQKLVDYYASMVQAAQQEQIKQAEAFRAEAEKVHGKNGIEQANRVLAKVGSPAFNQYLVDSGLGNHPEMVGMLKQVYSMMGESSFVSNNRSGNTRPLSAAEILYPTHKK